MTYINTIKFLLAILKEKGGGIEVETIDLNVGDKSFVTDIYRPKTKKQKGTILFIHGMNKLGHRDERMVALHRAAALCGYLVLAPNYEIIAHHTLDECSIDEIAETIKVVADDESLCPKQQLGIFSASFSGGMSFRAINRPEIGKYVTSFCSVGICYHPITTVGNLLSGRVNDNYARFIAIKSCLHVTGQLDAEGAHALDLAIDDWFLDEVGDRFQQYVKTLSNEKQERFVSIYNEIVNQEDVSKKYWNEILKLEETFVPIFEKEHLRSYITLIHSATDMVLPTEESRLMYEQLVKRDIPATLLVTPLLDHADAQVSFRQAKDAIKLINAFNDFFKHI